MEWLKKRRQKKEAEEAAENSRLEANRSAAEAECKRLNRHMHNQPCPINGNENCHEGCVHFRAARVVHYLGAKTRMIDIPEVWIAKKPKCKLWR